MERAHDSTQGEASCGVRGGGRLHAVKLLCFPAWWCLRLGRYFLQGGLLGVDMFAHDKSVIAYRGRSRPPETVVDHKRQPHQQLGLLPGCTSSVCCLW
jgi:hypothetical protein